MCVKMQKKVLSLFRTYQMLLAESQRDIMIYVFSIRHEVNSVRCVHVYNNTCSVILIILLRCFSRRRCKIFSNAMGECWVDTTESG